MLVHVPSYSFFAFNLSTLVLTYAKLEGDLFFFTWKMTLAPTILYFIILGLTYLKRVIIMDEKTYKESYTLRVNRFQLLDNFFHMVLTLLTLFFVTYFAYIQDLDRKDTPKKPLYITIGLYLFTQLVYTIMSKNIEEEPLLGTEKKKSDSLLTVLMTPILNFLGGSFMLCGGGQCSGIYGSTISAIFSAFGISVSEWLPYLDWLTLLLVLVSVGVLYYAKQDWKYKPFLMSCVAAVLIFADTLHFHMRYPVYVGNVLMIAGALWNSKLNKAGLFARRKKTAVKA